MFAKNNTNRRNIEEGRTYHLYWCKKTLLACMQMHVVNVSIDARKFQIVEITSSTWACVCCNLLFDLKGKEAEFSISE